MSLWDTITGMVRHEVSQYLYVPIPAGHVEGGQGDTEALVAGRDYFRIWLTEMSLKRDRDWFSTWHPAVHSLVRLQFGTEVIEVPSIAGEQSLPGVDAAHLDRAVNLNFPMTPLMPFSGGVVQVVAALLALQGQDYLKRFIHILGTFAGLVNVPQLSSALGIAGPVATGIAELLGGSNGDLHLGLHQAYVHKGGGDNELKPGYIAVVLATEAQVTPSDLWVVGGRLRRGPSAEASVPFEGFAYLLLRVQKETERDDWEGLTSFMEPFSAALDALGEGSEQWADVRYRAAVIAALKSDDLTRADRRRVTEVLAQRYQEAKNLGLPAASAWTSLTKAVAAIPVDEALALGEPDLSEFLPEEYSTWSPSGLGE